jgi:hypothetical protein
MGERVKILQQEHSTLSRRLRAACAMGVIVASSLVVIGAAPATASTKDVPVAAEVGCTSFTSFEVGAGFYLHVPSVGTDSFNFNCVLVRGSTNNYWAVVALQESLNACYQQELRVDGIFGQYTEEAVRIAQTVINDIYDPDPLRVDGRFGPRTSSYFKFQWYDHWNGGNHTGLCPYREPSRS